MSKIFQPLGTVGHMQGLNDGRQVAAQDGGQRMQRQPNAVVGDPALGEIVGSDFGTAVPGADLGSTALPSYSRS